MSFAYSQICKIKQIGKQRQGKPCCDITKQEASHLLPKAPVCCSPTAAKKNGLYETLKEISPRHLRKLIRITSGCEDPAVEIQLRSVTGFSVLPEDHRITGY